MFTPLFECRRREELQTEAVSITDLAVLLLLCGRPIGRITRPARPSVVCPVQTRNSKTKKRKKIKIGADVLQGTSSK